MKQRPLIILQQGLTNIPATINNLQNRKGDLIFDSKEIGTDPIHDRFIYN